MKRLMIVQIVFVMIVLSGGCGSTPSVKKVFVKIPAVYDVHENAVPTMNKMEQILKNASGEKNPEEIYVMSLYIKADKNEDERITKREAEKALKQYKMEAKIAIGALPFKIPAPE